MKLELDKKYANLNDEVQNKTKKLKKLRTMILQAESEIKDINDEHHRTMESLLDNVREMSKELKLQMQIIDSYIPFEFQVIIIITIMSFKCFIGSELKNIDYKCRV